MSTSINFPVLLAQLPHLQELAGADKARPEMAAAFNEQLAAEAQKKDNEQVQKVEKQEKLDAAGDKPPDERPGYRGSRRQRKQPEPEEDDSRSASPWAGNILNLKV
ncbi:MAG: hypothetical protein AB1916_01535 [Thermodesulfobacteriota bacterium]